MTFAMVTVEEEYYILSNAYVPEHSVGLMSCVSGGEPVLIEDYLCCKNGDWIVVVGFPLRQSFSIKEFEKFIDQIIERFRPTYLLLIAPKLPAATAAFCEEREKGHYYLLGINRLEIKRGLRHVIDKARDQLEVEQSFEIRPAHKQLSLEFVERVKPPHRVREILDSMENYVSYSKDARVLNAWDKEDNLAAFCMVDLAPKKFSTYVIGCQSRENYVAGATDLLLFETIKISKEYGKDYVNLCLAISDGIKQFEKKWRMKASLKYETCAIVL
jgi:hypothetical protein